MKDNRVKYRLKFKKAGRLRFIGHLDLLNLFHRAIRRSALPVSYSQGFNPHQETSFALPLSLGYYGNGEYVDIIFAQEVDGGIMTAKLNAAMPTGIEILSARRFLDGEKNAAAIVEAADYTAVLPEEAEIPSGMIPAFIGQGQIIVQKKTKKKMEQADIRPDILVLEGKEENGFVRAVHMRISAGPKRSLRADLVVKALCDFAGVSYNANRVTFIREELYKMENGKYVTLE